MIETSPHQSIDPENGLNGPFGTGVVVNRSMGHTSPQTNKKQIMNKSQRDIIPLIQ